MNRRMVALTLLGLLAVGSLAGCGRIMPNPTAATADLETTAVRRGVIVATVNAAGNLEPQAQVALSFEGGGRVREVPVKDGDR